MKKYILNRTEIGIETAKELILTVLKKNKNRQLDFKEIHELIDNQIGQLSIRGVLWVLVNEDKVKLRRFASNRLTYQLK